MALLLSLKRLPPLLLLLVDDECFDIEAELEDDDEVGPGEDRLELPLLLLPPPEPPPAEEYFEELLDPDGLDELEEDPEPEEDLW